MNPLPAAVALDAYFLEARCKLLDLAAILDRLDRGAGDLSGDPRVQKLRAGVTLLQAGQAGRAEAIQQLFSQAYDPAWSIPQPR